MRKVNKRSGVKLRLVLEADVAIGPGKAAILEGIRETGSITAAGRRQGMSYKRAWQLVDTLNHDFREPLVSTSKGGQRGGGARLTPLGEKVLDCYTRMVAKTEKVIARDLGQLRKAVAAMPDQPGG
jgi:molybdate transport system regulatory protein